METTGIQKHIKNIHNFYCCCSSSCVHHYVYEDFLCCVAFFTICVCVLRLKNCIKNGIDSFFPPSMNINNKLYWCYWKIVNRNDVALFGFSRRKRNRRRLRPHRLRPPSTNSMESNRMKRMKSGQKKIVPTTFFYWEFTIFFFII